MAAQESLALRVASPKQLFRRYGVRGRRLVLSAARVAAAAIGVLFLASAGESWSADRLPSVRVAALQFGTVKWELAVIAAGIDQKHGFRLQPITMADKDAASIALLSGKADAIVTDWLWVAKQRQLGRPYTFVPFSNAVGAVMAPSSAGIRSVSDLRGRRLGVAGGATDKSWLLLQAYVRKTTGFDLAEAADVQFAAPPLLNELLLRHRLDATLNFWPFNVKLAEKGMRPVINIADILPTLGFKTAPPLVGWVFDETWAARHPELSTGLIDASRQAKQKMKAEEGVWRDLRPIMAAETDQEFQLLKAGYRNGIPKGYGDADIAAAEMAFKIMRQVDPMAVAGLHSLPPGTFWQGQPQ